MRAQRASRSPDLYKECVKEQLATSCTNYFETKNAQIGPFLWPEKNKIENTKNANISEVLQSPVSITDDPDKTLSSSLLDFSLKLRRFSDSA
ncbi:unnamed protein product, partial [Nesidiocoris tenuis]